MSTHRQGKSVEIFSHPDLTPAGTAVPTRYEVLWKVQLPKKKKEKNEETKSCLSIDSNTEISLTMSKLELLDKL